VNMGRRSPSKRIDSRYWLVPILLAGVVVWSKQITIGGTSWSDAPLHVMDGVFLRDLLVHWRGGSLQVWAVQYYAKFPCLGLVVYYPPFFAIVEAVMFLIFGVSVIIARTTVILFAVLGLVCCYWVARQLLDRDAAVFATAIWASLPSTVLWARQVMLEVPTTAMILLCCGLYLKFRSKRRQVWRWCTAAALVLAVLTEQWAVFIAAVIAVDFAFTVGWKRAFNHKNVLVAAIAGGVISGYFLFAWQYANLSRTLVSGDRWAHLLSPGNWSFYISSLPEVLGWPALAFAVIGLLLLAAAGKGKQMRLAGLWVIIFYVFASVPWYKEPRYFYLITPAAAILAAGGLRIAVKGTKLTRPCEFLLLILICWQYLNSWQADPGRLADYRAAAYMVASEEDLQSVLVDAVRDGQFVFDLRRVQGYAGRSYALRGSELLYWRAAPRRRPYEEYVRSETDVLNLIDKYAIRYVVVESAPPHVPDWEDYFPRPSALLREVLTDERHFEKLASFETSTDPVWWDVRLEVYRNLRAGVRKQNRLRIPIPAMGKELEIILPDS